MPRNEGPEQPPKARGQLEGPHKAGAVRSRDLADPDEEVDGRAQDEGEGALPVGGGMNGLAQEAGNKAGAKVIHLIALAIHASGGAAGSNDHGGEASPL